MGKLARKNLIVDADELRTLAEKHGTSESQAVRYAVHLALAGYEMVDAMQQLHDMGAFADFEKVMAGEPVAAMADDEPFGLT